MAAKFEGAHSIGNREFPETDVSFHDSGYTRRMAELNSLPTEMLLAGRHYDIPPRRTGPNGDHDERSDSERAPHVVEATWRRVSSCLRDSFPLGMDGCGTGPGRASGFVARGTQAGIRGGVMAGDPCPLGLVCRTGVEGRGTGSLRGRSRRGRRSARPVSGETGGGRTAAESDRSGPRVAGWLRADSWNVRVNHQTFHGEMPEGSRVERARGKPQRKTLRGRRTHPIRTIQRSL